MNHTNASNWYILGHFLTIEPNAQHGGVLLLRIFSHFGSLVVVLKTNNLKDLYYKYMQCFTNLCQTLQIQTFY